MSYPIEKTVTTVVDGVSTATKITAIKPDNSKTVTIAKKTGGVADPAVVITVPLYRDLT